MVKIDKKIVGYRIENPQDKLDEEKETVSTPPKEERKTEILLDRPLELEGSTYKIKLPSSEHATYVTINNTVIERGEERITRPFEIFINSKNSDHQQWVTALTRVLSSLFRKEGDVSFLVDELKAVHDPTGGRFKTLFDSEGRPSGGVYVPSLVAEIGCVLEQHLLKIGYIKKDLPDPSIKALIEEKKKKMMEPEDQNEQHDIKKEYKIKGTQCPKCYNYSMVRLDGCETCLDCGYSKCG